MNRIIRMSIFLIISFLAIGIFYAITLYLLSLVITSELNIVFKLIIMVIGHFVATKFLYPAFIMGPFIGAVPKNLMFPKIYLPIGILFCLGLAFYFLKSYGYLFQEDFSFFSLNTILTGLFALTAFRILAPIVRFYFNTIHKRRHLSNVEIRCGIFEDQEELERQRTNQFYNPESSEIHEYWAKEYAKSNLDYYEQ